MSERPAVDRQLVERLGGVLARHPEVRLAILFGSRARGGGGGSDVDVAVEGTVDRLAVAAGLAAVAVAETDRPWFERMRDAYLRRLAARADGRP